MVDWVGRELESFCSVTIIQVIHCSIHALSLFFDAMAVKVNRWANGPSTMLVEEALIILKHLCFIHHIIWYL